MNTSTWAIEDEHGNASGHGMDEATAIRGAQEAADRLGVTRYATSSDGRSVECAPTTIEALSSSTDDGADYVTVVNSAREIAADVVASLPAGDEATVDVAVEAQAGERVRITADRLGYDFHGFHALVEREVSRLLNCAE